MSLGERKRREGNAYEICAHAACFAPEAEAHHALRLRQLTVWRLVGGVRVRKVSLRHTVQTSIKVMVVL